ncbi:MAG: TOBE domain-containing protein [Campylobacterales bacterium]|nr:TOBE domain-containing protein [Campylobacterales bacterium]
MKTSARNELKGTITEIKSGKINSEIILSIGGGATLTAVITNDSVEDMALKMGDSIYAIIKAPFVMVA